ncbi:dipeptide ABC transporter ATP-binding protein [Microlunatus soli]|uniref:Peptide/nickel transport system ATP-binding protein n=1 Tax=Microlunatus soli TaxID=630515 RepID=A0A1H2AQ85_9ACTN|nr:ABC transporter ATP-binding protein [Microlunatus soli]SDT47957.1 peptide/nickel transport system ATP-binding protein [Microlunatus soli]
MSLLEVAGLNVAAGRTALVQDLDLVIEPGERVGLIGESGSGKSLTCLSIMGLLPAGLTASGSLRLDGVDHDLLVAPESAWSTLRGRRLSMIFQEPMTALNPLMKVGRQVAEMMTLHGADAAAASRRTVELLDQVGLPDPAVAAQAYPHQLSGGQRQRVMLSMAMANSPDLLLADEPTTALDVTVQAQVLDLMRAQVREHGTALLFITHDLAVVSGMCQRVLIMKDGLIVESGSIDQVFSDPRHPYTRGLLAASALATDPHTGRLITVPRGPEPVEGPEPTQGPEPAEGLSTQPPALRQAQGPSDGQAQGPAAHDVLADGDPVIFNRSDAPVISVRELGRTYHRGRTSLFGRRREVTALDDLSFDVSSGDRFGIVGESGSGKSTLLRLLCALDSPTTGSVEVAGQQLAGAKERNLRALREQVQIVFQDPHSSLDPRMRIRDVVAEPLRAVSDAGRRSRVTEMLQAVGLPADAGDRFPHQFSGGQRQRIAIARALITEPSVLLADEAVSALDVSVRAQVLNLLADLVSSYRLTLVFVSHDLNVIRHLCDTVAVMQSGRIVECGPTEQLYAEPRHPYTERLIGALPELHTTAVGR